MGVVGATEHTGDRPKVDEMDMHHDEDSRVEVEVKHKTVTVSSLPGLSPHTPPLSDKSVPIQKKRLEDQTNSVGVTKIQAQRGCHELNLKAHSSEGLKLSTGPQPESVSVNMHSEPKATSTTGKSQTRSQPRASSLPKQSINETEVNSVFADACAAADIIADELKKSQEECTRLQRQVLALQKDVKESHDFIFSLQPRQASVTEFEADQGFRSLCSNVQDWVEREMGDFIYDKIIFRNGVPSTYLRKFLDYVPQAGREASILPDTDEYNITAVIMQFLMVKVFEKDFYCGVGDGESQVLGSIQESMRHLEPRRDVSALRSWRSEMYTAIANRPEFKDQLQHHSIHLSRELAKLLGIFIPRENRAGLQFSQSIEKSIIEPAFSLAHKLQLAVNKFSVRWSGIGEMSAEDRSHDLQDYISYQCVDLVKKGILITPQRAALLEDITYVFDLTPVLFVQVAKGDSFGQYKVASQGRILVAAMKKKEGRFVPPTMKKGEFPTLVYWMINRLAVRR